MQQLTLQDEEQARSIQQKDEQFRQQTQLVQRKDNEYQHLQQQFQAKDQQLQTSRRENEQVVAALQQSVEQKDAALRAKDELLQEKEREIRELQQRVREREGRGAATGPLKLEWRDGPPAPFTTFGYSVAVSGQRLFCFDFVSHSKILMFDMRTGQWTVLPECSKRFFSIAVVGEHFTVIGGEVSGAPTNSLLSLQLDKLDLLQQRWFTRFPPMTYSRNVPAVVTTQASLIVAGGWFSDREKSAVEVMDIQTLQWSTVASLPRPLWQATATVSGDTLYIGGGFIEGGISKTVLTCDITNLLQSAQPQPQSLFTRFGFSKGPQIWREIAPLPVVLSSLVTLQGRLLAVGGGTTFKGASATSEVWVYDSGTNSWSVMCHMSVRRCYCLTGVLQDCMLVVCGGDTPDGSSASVEIASVSA